MANYVFPTARKKFLEGDLSWTTDTIKVALLNSSATYNAAASFLSTYTANVLASAALPGRVTLAGAVADADNVDITLASGEIVRSLVIYVDSGSDATSQLIYWADNNEDTTPINRTSTGSIIVQWSTSGVFRL